jgi:hypothetical protein
MISVKEKMLAAQREASKRKEKYPSQVACGRMSKKFADYQIEVMQEIAKDYEQELARHPD